MTSQITKDVNNVYYDVIMPNTTTSKLVPAAFSEERTQDIVSRGSDYEMSIVRFAIPGSTIPVKIVETLIPQASTTAGWVDKNTLIYSVSLQYGANVYRVYLQWVAESSLIQPADTVDTTNIYSFQYYSLFSYQYFTDLVNIALSTAFTALKTANPAAVQTASPYLVYNPSNKLYSLVAQSTYVTDANQITIFFNQPLFYLFNSFSNIYNLNATLGRDYQINFKYNYDSVVPPINQIIIPAGCPGATTAAYVMTQEYPVLFNWNSMKSIVFTSGNIPLRKEYQATLNQSGVQNFLPIVTDMIPLTADGTENRSTIVYNPTAEYRFSDLVSEEPLRKFQINLFWQDNKLRLYPIYINPNDFISLKILFRRKHI